MKQKSITKNYIYNLLYQVLLVLFPLLTAPYLSRILGAEKLGIYSYTLSVSAYFILFGSLGISLYGQREIAYKQKNKEEYSKILWEILILRLIMVTISLIIYFHFFASQQNEYGFYYRILIVEIIASIFDISWFFQGMEDFKKTISRNIIVKILSIASIFIFVKSSEDLTLYFIIYVASVAIGNLSLWLYLPKYLSKIKLNIVKPFRHFKSTILLFIPQIAIEIYTVLDKTMIGAIIDDKSEVGYYDQAQKIVKMSMMLVTSIGVVMMPRIAARFADGDRQSITRYIYRSFNLVLAFGVPLIAGIVLMSDAFVPFFFGDGYEKTAILMKILSPIIVFIGISNSIGMQYLLSVKRQNEFTISVIVGSITNFVMNIILIPHFASIGAAVGTLIAELSVAVVQMIFVRKEFRVTRIAAMLPHYIIGSAAMVLSIIAINALLPLGGVWSLIIPVVAGFVVYITATLLLRDEFIKAIFDKIITFAKSLLGRKKTKA